MIYEKQLLVLVLCLGLSACSPTSNSTTDDDKISDEVFDQVEVKDTATRDRIDESLEDKAEVSADKSREEVADDSIAEEEISEFEQIIGHSLDDSIFEMAYPWDDKKFELKLASDGTFVGGYKGVYHNATMPEPVYVLCDIKGKFTLGDEVEDKVYELILSDVEMTSTPGHEIDLGDKIGVYADYIPLFDVDAEYRLGLAGANLPDVASREGDVFEGTTNDTGILQHNVIYEKESKQPYFEIQGTEPTTINLSEQSFAKENKSSKAGVDFSEVLGHDLENFRFSLAKLMGYYFTDFALESDGSFKGSFVSRGSNFETQDLEFKKSEFKGRFELGEQIEDKKYKLYLTELEVTSPTGEETLVFDPDQDKEVRQTYVDSTPGLSKDSFYHLVLKGSTDPTALDAVNHVYQKNYRKTKVNVIVEGTGNPVFYENVKRDENGKPVIDLPEGVFEDLDGMVLDYIFGASQITRTVIEFEEDGSFKGDYRTGDTRNSTYHELLQANAQKYRTYANIMTEFEGRFEIVDKEEDGIYNLKLVDLEVTSEDSMESNDDITASSTYLPSLNKDDEYMLIETGAHLPIEKRKGTALEVYFNPPEYLDPAVREDYSYGFILYNVTQDIVLTEWRTD